MAWIQGVELEPADVADLRRQFLQHECMLIVIGGLPATGKTTLRVDTIEQAIVRSGLAHHPVGPVGYVVGYALAKEYLHQGLTVIAESVNPLAVTRDSWRDVETKAAVAVAEVEVICSAPAEHRRRVTSRSVDIPDLPLPDWQQILDRDYASWDREHIVIDTAEQDPQESLAVLLHSLDRLRSTPHNSHPAYVQRGGVTQCHRRAPTGSGSAAETPGAIGPSITQLTEAGCSCRVG